MCAEFALKEGDGSIWIHAAKLHRTRLRAFVTERHVAVGEVMVWHGRAELDQYGVRQQVDAHIVQRSCSPSSPFTANFPAPRAVLMQRWKDGRRTGR